jgi:hypothetical protein
LSVITRSIRPGLGEAFGRTGQEGGARRSAFVGEHFDVGEPGVIVDGDVEVVVAHDVGSVVRPGLPSELAPTAAGTDLAELLHVDVDEFPETLPLVADRRAGGPVGLPEPRNTRAPEDPVDRRAGVPERRAEAVRSPAEAPPGGEDPAHLTPGEGPGTPERGRAAVDEALEPFGLEAPQPLVDGGPGHAHRFGSRRSRPSLHQDPLDQDPSAERCELRPTMGHESLLPVGVVNPAP